MPCRISRLKTEVQLQAVRRDSKRKMCDRTVKRREAIRLHLAQIGASAKIMEDNIRSMGEEAKGAREFCEEKKGPSSTKPLPPQANSLQDFRQNRLEWSC